MSCGGDFAIKMMLDTDNIKRWWVLYRYRWHTKKSYWAAKNLKWCNKQRKTNRGVDKASDGTFNKVFAQHKDREINEKGKKWEKP